MEIIMGSDTLYIRDARGEFKLADGEAVVAAAKAHLSRRVRRGTSLTSPKLVGDFLATKLGNLDCEYFCLIALDSRHRFIDYVELFRGTIDGASVHPREVVKTVLDLRAAAVILAHNHPSGVAEPSRADEQITKRLIDVLKLIDVRVIDHVIVGAAETFSFAERNLL